MPQCTILIVEREYLIRTHAADVINGAGYEVIEAANADEAIAILEVRTDIRVVFADIHMSGPIDGRKLTHVIRDRWPGIHLIATARCHPAHTHRCSMKAHAIPVLTGFTR